MPHLLFMALALLSSAEPPANPPAPPATALDMVTALETVLADAIARAEPSVVAIARDKSSDGKVIIPPSAAGIRDLTTLGTTDTGGEPRSRSEATRSPSIMARGSSSARRAKS